MCVGYDPSTGDNERYSDLDEYLCEYVDGEMDPSVRAAFEEYLLTDPALAEHVECLRHTRAVLCAFSCRVGAPCGLHRQLRMRLDREVPYSVPTPLSSVASMRLNRAAGWASIAALVLMSGLFIGNADTRSLPAPSVAASQAPTSTSIPAAGPMLDVQQAARTSLTWMRGARPSYAAQATSLFNPLQHTSTDSHHTAYASLEPALRRIGARP